MILISCHYIFNTGLFLCVGLLNTFRHLSLSLHRLETEQNPWVCLTSALLAYSSSLAQINIGNEVLTMCRSLYTTKHKLNPQVRVWVSSSLHTSSTDRMFNVKKIICEDAENAPNFVLDLCAFPVTCYCEFSSAMLIVAWHSHFTCVYFSALGTFRLCCWTLGLGCLLWSWWQRARMSICANWPRIRSKTSLM